MHKTRVIPVLLLQDKRLVKTKRFKAPVYVGDPLNAVRIFNEKEVDELIFLDISASTPNSGPDFTLLAEIASEAFMPMAYGGGITSLKQVENVLALGFEKVIFNNSTFLNSKLIASAANRFGSQSIVACLDIKKSWTGHYAMYTNSGSKRQRAKLLSHLEKLMRIGVGEVIVNSIDREGCQIGYDLDLLAMVSSHVDVPVVACGGAGQIQDFVNAVNIGGASAVAAGSMFVFFGPHRAVLISYPDRNILNQNLP